MSTIARRNGWRGFEELGQKYDASGWDEPPVWVWEYTCEAAGPPHVEGCHGSTKRKAPWTKVGIKGGGWLIFYGANDDGTDDTDVVLVLCPSCRRKSKEASR